jgi:hypothetical protein
VLAQYAFGPTTKSNLDSWINSASIVVTSVRDPDNMQGQTINALVRREYCYVVDLHTMHILKIYIGTTNGNPYGTGISSSVVCGMCDILGRLGASTTGCPTGC